VIGAPLAPGRISVAWLWAASIVLAWIAVAVALGQPLWQQQHSRDLVDFGAIAGNSFEIGDTWRLIASQWLHVNAPHMLFNALAIGLVGQAAERRLGWIAVLLVGMLGGVLGQLATVLLQPGAYVSGASQAYLALCGLALPTIGLRSPGWWLALLALLVAICLDVVAAGHGLPKIGHVAAFAAGSLAGLGTRLRAQGTEQSPSATGAA
jgi:membrane associated rhomboid family serine protease